MGYLWTKRALFGKPHQAGNGLEAAAGRIYLHARFTRPSKPSPMSIAQREWGLIFFW